MSPLLEARVIEVTGRANGIGLAICWLFWPRRSPGGPHWFQSFNVPSQQESPGKTIYSPVHALAVWPAPALCTTC